MKKYLFFFLAIFIFCAITGASSQAIHFVKEGGTGDGTSWASASGDLQLMINSSVAGDQVWVAGGTYYPIRRADALNTVSMNDRNNAFVLKTDVKIYGGFAGGETTLLARNLSNITNTSILSGYHSDPHSNPYHSYHVVISAGPVGSAELNGFNIQSGYAVGTGTNLLIFGISTSDQDGGGILITSSSPILTNLTVSGNIASESGGGVYNSSSSSVLTYVNINRNSAGSFGGGMYNLSSSSIISNVNISENENGGMYNSSSSPVLTNVIISDNGENRMAQNGGGIYNSFSSPILTNVTISNNFAQNGGGIFNDASSPKIRNSIIFGNNGGIVNTSSSFPEITNSLVQGLTDESNGNISGVKDPLFVSPGDNYRLQTTSPAINVGSNTYFNAGETPDLSANTTDLDGHARIQGGTIDLGAYESSVPAAVAGNISGAAAVCSGTNSTTLTLSGYTGTIQWQSSTDNVTFNNIAGATGATYTASNLTATTWYKAVVTSGGESETSPGVALAVNQKSSDPTDARTDVTGNVICNGGIAKLILSGVSNGTGEVIRWYTDAACTQLVPGQSGGGNGLSVSPTTPTTYWGRFEDPAPCNYNSATKSVTLTVTPNASAGTVTAGTSPQCIGSTTNYTVSGAVLSGGTGAWSSSNTAVATVDQTGLVTAIGGGFCNIFYTISGGCNTAQSSQPYRVNVPPSITVTNSNPHLYFGAPGDQTSTITASATGGTAPYSITFSSSRALISNFINDEGDEVWTATGSTITSANPPSVFTGIADGGHASINVALLADADITATVTDVNGCAQTAAAVHVVAEDARCFAGKSKNVKVSMCHVTGSAKNPRVQICVSQNAVQSHLNHGDLLGSCTVNVRDMNVNAAHTSEMVTDMIQKEEVLGKLSVTVMPNPSSYDFELLLKSLSTENVKIIVTDVIGRVIEKKTGISANSTIQLGDKYHPGIYIAKLLQGKDEVILRLIKSGS